MNQDHRTELVKAIRYRGQKAELKTAVSGLAAEITVTLITLIIVFTCVFGITVQHGNDMYPAIRDGDVILYYRNALLLPTEAVVYEAGGETHTGRIAGVPGAKISRTDDGQLTVNGIYQPVDARSGIYAKTVTSDDQKLPFTVSDGSYYILNDDRNRMSDSRTLGEIPGKDIKGRIITVLRRRTI